MQLVLDAHELLDDQALFRRTPAGQRELLDTRSSLTAVERKFLAVVTGHTPLRVLLEMGLDQPDIAATIMSLAGRGLIAIEDPG